MKKLVWIPLVVFLQTSYAQSPVPYDSADQVNKSASLRIVRVTPSGKDVPPGRQVVFQFDRPVVAIGRMERDSSDIPIDISPALACEWRWINTSALACQLSQANQMKAATQYNITVEPKISTQDGARLQRTSKYSVITARPKVSYTRFVNWLSPGTPLIQITFNQSVTKTSVEKNISMTGGQQQGQTAVVAHPDDIPRQFPYWMRTHAEVEYVDDQATITEGTEARKVWLVEPAKELPLDKRVHLKVHPGIVGSEGNQSGIEERTIVAFDTYPNFEFLGIRCTLEGEAKYTDIDVDVLAKYLESSDGAGQQDNKHCAPLKPVSLIFSSPVKNSTIRDHVPFNPPLDGDRKDYDPWQNVHDWTHLGAPHVQGRRYYVWLPELLKAFDQYDFSVGPEVVDEFQRPLNKANDVAFFTGHRAPRLRLNHPHAVLEKGIKSDIPLYVTNLNSVEVNYQRLTKDSTLAGLNSQIEIPRIEDIAFAQPLGARQLVDNSTGIIQGTLEENPPPPNTRWAKEFFVQVSAFQVHAKIGHFNSLVWVTRFADGKSVRGAKVTLVKGTYQNLVETAELSYTAKTDRRGIAQLPGTVELDPKLALVNRYRPPSEARLFIKVEKGNDIALLPLDHNYQAYSRGAYSQPKQARGHAHAWGTTAQGIYKLGDTVEYKLYIRDQTNEHWSLPESRKYTLRVIDPQQQTVHERTDIELNDFGAISGEFPLPTQGATGYYQFELDPAGKKKEKYGSASWQPLTVLVSDFTPSPFNVATEINGDQFHAGDQITTLSMATMFAGGPFTDAEVRLTARLQTKPFTSNSPVLSGFKFGSFSGTRLNREQQKLLDIRSVLDKKGEHQNTFSVPEADVYFGDIVVESAVKDDRGKFVASTTTADFVGRDRFVGLRNTRWLYAVDKPADIEVVVVDDNQNTVADSDVTVSILRQEFKASRVKGPGNAYLTQNIVEWSETANCEIASATEPQTCEFTPTQPGYYQFIATLKDTKGRQHKTTNYGWVTGQGAMLWSASNDATLGIVAERTDYKVGDTARYLIKNPFPDAKALVSVERYGVLDSWIETFDTATPVVEFEVKADYLPGFYLSVVAISPRVEPPSSSQGLDLGKPSYRMGYVRNTVTDSAKELDITVVTNKSEYRPRDTVTANIHVNMKKANRERVEIAVAVVDEAVLALNQQGTNYYDPYRGFNRLDALDLNNYSLVSRLVGLQKFEKKAANPGGGGGTPYSALRNRFKFVSFWNPSVLTDARGNATIEFEVPDSLTGWRILAFAVTPNDRMGLGYANYKVNRPTEIRPAMPNQLTEGDQFNADFSILNRTNKSREIVFRLLVEGAIDNEVQPNHERSLNLEPFGRANIGVPISTAPINATTPPHVRLTASAGDGVDRDKLQHIVPVNKRRSLETAANYGTTTSAKVDELIKIPDNIFPDVGYLGAVLSPTVIGNVEGAFDAVREYPYLCWEQRLTKAVMASAFISLQDYMSETTKWPDASATVASTLSVAGRFQAPNGGMAYWRPNNQYVSPYLSAYTALALNWLRDDGYQIPTETEKRLHAYLQRLLRKNDFPSFYSKGMSSSVRAVALAALAEHGQITVDDIERYAPHLPEMDLFGKAHFLSAALSISGSKTAEATLDAILSQSSHTAGKVQFNELLDDSYKHLLATPTRSNCAVLSSLLLAESDDTYNNKIGDIPFKMVRAITQARGSRTHWENTQENVFCMNALVDYSQRYEKDSVDFSVTVSADQAPIGQARFRQPTDSPITISRPLNQTDAGKTSTLSFAKEGSGRLYYSARLAYDLVEDSASRINSGIEIRREYSIEKANGEFELLKSPMVVQRGDIVRVDLFVSAPTARHFVVIDDPVPGGLEPINTNLATTSTIDASKSKFKVASDSWWFNLDGWSYFGRYHWSFYHKQLDHDAAKFYADYLPAGNYHLSYSAQAIGTGNFTVMPANVEEMYDPDVYGKGLPAMLKVVAP